MERGDEEIGGEELGATPFYFGLSERARLNL